MLLPTAFSFAANRDDGTPTSPVTIQSGKVRGLKNGNVNASAHPNPAIKPRIDQWQADSKKRMSPKDAAAVDQNFLSFLKVACRSDLIAAQQHMSYDYFQRQLTERQQERNAMAEFFDKIIKGIQKER